MQVGLIRNGVLNAQLNLPRVRITLLLRITETTAVALETAALRAPTGSNQANAEGSRYVVKEGGNCFHLGCTKFHNGISITENPLSAYSPKRAKLRTAASTHQDLLSRFPLTPKLFVLKLF
jgi:hypothetical protein